MKKTITLEMTESQAETLETLLDKTLEMLNRWEVKSGERDKSLDMRYEENMKKLRRFQKRQTEADNILAKWQTEMEGVYARETN